MSESMNHIYPWGHDRRFNAYSNYFRRIFGGRVQKLSIDAGFTCPNRDGTKGRGGCTFCNNDAFSPSYCRSEVSITSQVEKGISFHSKRYRKARAYLAYFQAYTNTYADIDILKNKYEEALQHPQVKGLIIGTRPDCVDDEILDYIQDLSANHYMAVEYGVESCYDRTLKRVNRGHDYASSVLAIEKTAARGINTGAHFIFGLPGESRQDMMKMSGIISKLPLKTVKFHQLQIIKGTMMEKEFLTMPEEFELFSWDEYREFFIQFLERLNPEFIVERFTGESRPDLIANQPWSGKRSDELLKLFEDRMEELDTWQGRLYDQEPDNNKLQK